MDDEIAQVLAGVHQENQSLALRREADVLLDPNMSRTCARGTHPARNRVVHLQKELCQEETQRRKTVPFASRRSTEGQCLRNETSSGCHA